MKRALLISIRRITYHCVYWLDRITNGKKPAIVVFCFHGISKDDWRFNVTPQTFKKLFSYICSYASPATVRDLEAYISGNVKWNTPRFMVTFDDGYSDILKIRIICKTYNIQPVLFVLSDTRRANRNELGTDKTLLTDDEIKSLSDDGWVIGSHSATHADLSSISGSRLRREIAGSKKRLESILGLKVNYFSYPKGKYNSEIIRAVKDSGFSMAFSMDEKEITPHTDRFTVPRIGTNRTLDDIEMRALPLRSSINIRNLFMNTMKISI